MEFTAAVLTMSDKGSKGERKDTSGPAICELLENDGWKIIYTKIIPDDFEIIKKELQYCVDTLDVCLVTTTGGTGFSKKDITPEATKAVIERETPGIPEAMRAESMRITPKGMLSREAAGIRKETLIVNMPGSEKAVRECLAAVMPGLKHGIEILRGTASECGIHHNKA